jgi:hypothetical protein
MTRKHFNVIAKVLNDQKIKAGKDLNCAEFHISGIVHALADEFSQFNKQFNKRKFVNTCKLLSKEEANELAQARGDY